MARKRRPSTSGMNLRPLVIRRWSSIQTSSVYCGQIDCLSRNASDSRGLRIRRGRNSSSADADVVEAGAVHFVWPIEISTVYHDGRSQQFADTMQIEAGEVGPVGEDQEGIRTGDGCVAAGSELDSRGEQFVASVVDGRRIVGRN